MVWAEKKKRKVLLSDVKTQRGATCPPPFRDDDPAGGSDSRTAAPGVAAEREVAPLPLAFPGRSGNAPPLPESLPAPVVEAVPAFAPPRMPHSLRTLGNEEAWKTVWSHLRSVALLPPEQRVPPFAVWGPVGCGKTTGVRIALEAFRYRAVFYGGADEEGEDALVARIRQDRMVMGKKNCLEGKKVAVVLDGFETFSSPAAARLGQMLSSEAGGLVVVTAERVRRTPVDSLLSIRMRAPSEQTVLAWFRDRYPAPLICGAKAAIRAAGGDLRKTEIELDWRRNVAVHGNIRLTGRGEVPLPGDLGLQRATISKDGRIDFSEVARGGDASPARGPKTATTRLPRCAFEACKGLLFFGTEGSAVEWWEERADRFATTLLFENHTMGTAEGRGVQEALDATANATEAFSLCDASFHPARFETRANAPPYGNCVLARAARLYLGAPSSTAEKRPYRMLSVPPRPRTASPCAESRDDATAALNSLCFRRQFV